MNCQDLLKNLNEYVDGTVEPARCEELDNHMAGCNPCQVVLNNIRGTITLYKAGQPCDLPLSLHERLQAVLRQRWRENQAGTPSRQ